MPENSEPVCEKKNQLIQGTRNPERQKTRKTGDQWIILLLQKRNTGSVSLWAGDLEPVNSEPEHITEVNWTLHI